MERRRTWLTNTAIAYLNVDIGAMVRMLAVCNSQQRLCLQGFSLFQADSVPSLSALIREVAQLVPYTPPAGEKPTSAVDATEVERRWTDEQATAWDSYSSALWHCGRRSL